MMRLQLLLAVAAVIVVSSTNAEARGGRRGGYYQGYAAPYYNYNANYNTVPAYTNTVPAATQTSTTITTTSAPAATAQTVTPADGVVQTNATAPAGGVVQAGGSTSATTTGPVASTSTGPKPNSNGAVVGSAQWKAEQCARNGSVAHIGGGFGGGSYEGNGFGFSPEQAITGSCFWGQRQPIEIGVARGANGYYAVVFYR